MNNSHKPMTSGSKVAILVASGFTERHMTALQRAMMKNGAKVKVVGMESGLVNGWAGESWGHHYMVDTALNTALASDFDALIVPGGARSADKLKMTKHTKRFISGFISADKPCVMLDEAADLLTATGLSADAEGADTTITLESLENMDDLVQAVMDHMQSQTDIDMAA